MKENFKEYKKPIQLLCGLFAFLILSLVFQSSRSFYELGAYKNYLVSMLNDHDFNIINQVAPPANWLITQNYFHPDFHTEAYTGFLALFSLCQESLFHISFAAFNFFCLFLGFKFNLETLKKLQIKVNPLLSLVFFFSTALFYYSVFWANAPDILIFLLTSYLIYKSFEPNNLLVVGICLGYLVILRPMNIFMFVPFLYSIWIGKGKVKNLAMLFMPFLLLMGADAYLKFLKFSSPVSLYYISNSYITNFDIKDFAWSFIWGFFGPIGVFTINLSYFIGLLGLISILKKQKSNILPLALACFGLFVSYMVMMLSFLGPIVEDQLPGRFFINLAPFFFIGFAVVFEKMKSKIIGASLVIIHQILFFQYYLIHTNNYYQYPNEHFLNADTAIKYFLKVKDLVTHNLQNNFQHLHPFLLFVVLVSVLILFLKRYPPHRIFQGMLVAASLSYFAMFFVHLLNYEKNISSMKSDGTFAQSSMATGAEALGLDYLLDAAETISRYSDSVTRDRLKSNLQPYFKVLKTQVKTQDPGIIRLIDEESFELSFLVRQDK